MKEGMTKKKQLPAAQAKSMALFNAPKPNFYVLHLGPVAGPA